MKSTSKTFDTHLAKDNIGHHAVRSGTATLLGQGAKFLLQMLATAILARLLTPKDYGIVAMITAVTAFLAPFKDFGLSTATLQRNKINHAQVSSLFWINTAAGVLLALCLTVCAPFISKFYGEPILTLTICVFSTRFILEGIAIQHQAIMRRRMMFKQLSILEVITLTLAYLAAIGAAWAGMGYWALVLQQLVFPMLIAIGVWWLCSWRPGFPKRRQGVRSMVTFGGQLTVAQILHAFTRNFDNVLIGWRWGAGALGFYSKAYALLLLPINQINVPLQAVALSSLSRLQKDPDRYRQFYCRLVTLLTFATTPLIVVLAVLSRDIILILLGEQWVEASTIFTVLAIAALGQPVAGTIGLVYTSLGQSDRLLRWTLIAAPVEIISFVIGLPWGALGVATSYAIAVHLLRFPALWYAFRYSPIKIMDFLKAVWRPVAVSGWMLLCMLVVRDNLTLQYPLVRLIICCISGGVFFVAGVILWPETRREAFRLMKLVADLWKQPQKISTSGQ